MLQSEVWSLQCNEILCYNQPGQDSLPELQDIPSRSPGWSSNTKCNKDPDGPGLTISRQLREVLKDSVEQSSPPSATLIKVDFSLNLFFLSLRCFITDIFSSNIFVPFFICRPAQVLYSQSACQKISPKLDCIKSRSLYCSALAKIIWDQQKTREGKIKKSKDRNTFST